MSDIKQVPPILTVIEDDGEYVIRASGENGKRMAQSVLREVQTASRVTFISDNDVKVFKNAKAREAAPKAPEPEETDAPPVPAKPRARIIQDGAAPPSPELVEDDYQKILRQQEEEAAAVARQQAFNSQQATPQQEEAEETPAPRKRERQLSVAGSPCGRCGGQGTVQGDAGFEGACPVCQGKGEIKAWGRGRRAK